MMVMQRMPNIRKLIALLVGYVLVTFIAMRGQLQTDGFMGVRRRVHIGHDDR